MACYTRATVQVSACTTYANATTGSDAVRSKRDPAARLWDTLGYLQKIKRDDSPKARGLRENIDDDGAPLMR